MANRRRGSLKGASLRGEWIACGMCATTWEGGHRRKSCPKCGASLNQLILSRSPNLAAGGRHG